MGSLIDIALWVLAAVGIMSGLPLLSLPPSRSRAFVRVARRGDRSPRTRRDQD